MENPGHVSVEINNPGLCLALQSATDSVSIGIQNALAGDEGLAQNQAGSVKETAILLAGM
jgi:hypothetical protein